MKRLASRLTRDLILFIAGLAGIAYETVVDHGEKPTLIVLFGAMVGLPAFLRKDESAHGKKETQVDETDGKPKP